MAEATRRWRDWKPTQTTPTNEPTKPSELVFDGSDAASSGDLPKKKPTLADVPPDAPGIPWAEWHAQAMDRMVKEVMAEVREKQRKEAQDAKVRRIEKSAGRDASSAQDEIEF